MSKRGLLQLPACVSLALLVLVLLSGLIGGQFSRSASARETALNRTPPPPAARLAVQPAAAPDEIELENTCYPHLWTNKDIGAVELPGGSSYDNGVFTVSGAGWDIWERADAFHFAYQPLSGDAELVAQVVGQGGANPWAKAGVMIRESLAPNAAHTAVFVTPDNGVGFQQRAQTGKSCVMTAGPLVSAPVWLKLQRRGAQFSGFYSLDGASWEVIGTTTLNLAASVYVGLAVTSHDGSLRDTANFTDVTVNGVAPFVLKPVTTQSPAARNWTSLDVGNVGQRGGNRFIPTGMTVRGAGYDIWDVADAFHFLYVPFEGDGQIVARLNTQLNTDPWAKAGVMIREDLTPGARNAAMLLTPEQGGVFQQRLTPQRATRASLTGPREPYGWIKLVRRCASFSGYLSSDGEHWTLIGTQTVQMASRVYAGLAVSSHIHGTLGEASFSEVRVTQTKPVTTGAVAQFYVAPDGTPGGDGSLAQPWDLATALAMPRGVRPGTLLWVRGGVYAGAFVSELTGLEDEPIVLRVAPGERAIIDGNGFTGNPLTVNGADAVYWGLEVTNSNPDRTKARAGAVNVFGARTKFINMVLHDANEGFGFWTAALDAELYGNLIYNGGWQGPAPDRGHGHGIYAQNDTGTKIVRDNVIFNQFGFGIHAYTEGGAINGFHLEGNVSFNNGQPVRERTRTGNILIGGLKPAERITLINNYTFHPRDTNAVNVQLFYGAADNQDLDVRGNYFANGNATVAIREWLQARFTRNVIVGKLGLLSFHVPVSASPAAYAWDNNTYYQTGPPTTPFNFTEQYLPFEDWRAVSGFDRASRFTQGSAPTQVQVRGNQYEAGRAHLIVYNGEQREFVEAEVGQVLQVGARYEVRNAQDYYGAPVLSGTYSGGPLRLPMNGLSVAQPLGVTGVEPTGPEFNVFVLLRLT
jgi:hypothetical protein